jgi:hypothetical protein
MPILHGFGVCAGREEFAGDYCSVNVPHIAGLLLLWSLDCEPGIGSEVCWQEQHGVL